MDANVTQHQDFLPQYDEWDQLCQTIQSGKSQYEAEIFVTLLRRSTDSLVAHLADEIPTMEVRLASVLTIFLIKLLTQHYRRRS